MNIKFLLIFITVVIGGVFIYFMNHETKPELSPLENPVKNQTPVEDLSSHYTIKPVNDWNKTIKSIGLTMDNFPTLDGATASQPIRSLIACVAFNITCYWYETVDREMFLSADFYGAGSSFEEQEKMRSKIEKNSKTHDAYLNLIYGKIDLILVSTKPSDDELKEAKKLGVKLELVPIGLDGFVFLVNKKNPVRNLNTSDIVDIYSGKINNWKKFTGLNSSITAFTRPNNSGSQELIEKLVMKGIAMDASLKKERVISAMAPLIDGVETYENSIGYSLYYYKNNMIDKRDRQPNVKLISVDGIEPNPENIASGKYPYTFEIYAVTRDDEPKNASSYQIKEWLAGKEGQEIIKKAGYLSLRP